MEIIEQIGSYAGLAAIVGLAGPVRPLLLPGAGRAAAPRGGGGSAGGLSRPSQPRGRARTEGCHTSRPRRLAATLRQPRPPAQVRPSAGREEGPRTASGKPSGTATRGGTGRATETAGRSRAPPAATRAMAPRPPQGRRAREGQAPAERATTAPRGPARRPGGPLPPAPVAAAGAASVLPSAIRGRLGASLVQAPRTSVPRPDRRGCGGGSAESVYAVTTLVGEGDEGRERHGGGGPSRRDEGPLDPSTITRGHNGTDVAELAAQVADTVSPASNGATSPTPRSRPRLSRSRPVPDGARALRVRWPGARHRSDRARRRAE